MDTTFRSLMLERTLDMMRDRPRHVTYEAIEAATGIKASWLKHLVNGKIDDPGVKRIEQLYNHLNKTPFAISE